MLKVPLGVVGKERATLSLLSRRTTSAARRDDSLDWMRVTSGPASHGSTRAPALPR